jgi:hypothetical protein
MKVLWYIGWRALRRASNKSPFSITADEGNIFLSAQRQPLDVFWQIVRLVRVSIFFLLIAMFFIFASASARLGNSCDLQQVQEASISPWK